MAVHDESRSAGSSDDTPLRTLIAAPSLRAFATVSELRAFSSIALQYILIIAAVWISEASGSWLVTGASLLFIATRQHALAVIMHDAAHYLLSRRKRLNDFVACLFCSFPLFVSIGRYRENHLKHHRKTNAPDDPDLDDNTHPPHLSRLIQMLAADFFLLSLPKQMRRARKFGVLGIFKEDSRRFGMEQYLLVAFVATLVLVCSFTTAIHYLLLYWLVPFFTVCQVLLRFRGFSEHAGRMGEKVLNGSRSIEVSWWERVLLAPCNVNRHLEHHLYPSVPSYNLEKLSKELMLNDSFRDQTRITSGYVGRGNRSVLGELYERSRASESVV